MCAFALRIPADFLPEGRSLILKDLEITTF